MEPERSREYPLGAGGAPRPHAMPDHLTIKDYLLHAVNRDAFLEEFPEPVLVRKEGGAEPEPGSEKPSGFSTLRIEVKGEGPGLGGMGVPHGDVPVHPIRDSGRNSHAGLITVGRAPANDIVLPLPGISKLHAYFLMDPETCYWCLVDNSSTNGTSVGGEQLREKQPVALVDGQVISFAEVVEFTFHTPEGLFDLLGPAAGF
jgi:hypothetical protein